ncbi:MAG: DsbA family protein [Cyanobacteria bacterium P01_E01_bin.34]
MVSRINCWFAVALSLVLLTSCSATQSSVNLEQQVLDIIRANPDIVLEAVQSYQIEQQAAAQSQALAQYEIALQGIAADPTSEIGQSPIKGAAELQYVLYEFSDFECPFCGRSQPVISEFLGNHPDVTLVYKHFPLVQIHPQAIPAAQASWAAQQQDKFWEYHDALFANQGRLGDDYYLELASELNLNMAIFERDRQAASDAISRDIRLGESIGLNGTPFFTLNGIPLPGAVPLEALESALEQAKNA